MPKGRGWHKHPIEHGLAARGISTKNKEFRTRTPLKRPLNEKLYNNSKPEPIQTRMSYHPETKMDEPASRIDQSATKIAKKTKNKDVTPRELDTESRILRKNLNHGKTLSLNRDWYGHPKRDASLMQIYYNSPVIRQRAYKALRKLEAHQSEIDPYMYEIARNSYRTLISLTYAMEASVENGQMIRNPYHDENLNKDIDNLQISVQKWKYQL